MEFLNWFLNPVKNHYIDFTGRASRKEFWMFILVYFIIYIVISVIDSMLGLMGILAGIFSLAVLLPALGIGARRLHDTGISGWWQLLGLIPLIGVIIVIILMVRKGEAGTNKHGMPPGGTAAAMDGQTANTPPQTQFPGGGQSEG